MSGGPAGRYRVGVIGCGGISNAHLRAYRRIPVVEVVAGADVSEAVRQDRQARTDELGIPRMYANAGELFEREQLDLRPVERKNAPTGYQQWEETGMRYGHHVETGALAMIQFQGGARATVESGIVQRRGKGGRPMTVYGTEGFVEVGPDRPEGPDGFQLRARVKGEPDWVYPAVAPSDGFTEEIQAMLTVLERGGAHPLNARAAREVHEILMAIFESARRRARIDLPLDVEDRPLEALLAERS